MLRIVISYCTFSVISYCTFSVLLLSGTVDISLSISVIVPLKAWYADFCCRYTKLSTMYARINTF